MTVEYKVYYTYPADINRINNVTDISIDRGVHPREDNFSVNIAGIEPSYEVGREIFFYRVNSDIGENIMLFRGIITKRSFGLSPSGKVTKLTGKGLWYTLEMRLLGLPGYTPHPYSTNPYIMQLNKNLQNTLDTMIGYIVYASSHSRSSAYVTSIEMGTNDFPGVVVNDQCFFQYVSYAQALERLVSSAIPEMMGEFQLDFTQSPPKLNIKRFDPDAGYYGIGENKSEEGSPNSFCIAEYQNAEEINISLDFENMANSIVNTGAKFFGAEIAVAEIVNEESILQYGFKQFSKSIGNAVTQYEIERYQHNILPLISTPIPSIDVTFFKDAFLKTKVLNPGDVIAVNSPTLSGVFGSQTFNARVRKLSYRWRIGEGERISCSLTYPVSRSNQFIAGFANPTIDTLMSSLKRETKDALYTTTGGTYEFFPLNFSFELKDTTLKSFYVFPIDITTLNVKEGTGSDATVLIKGMRLNAIGQTNNENKINVSVVAPDGLVVFKHDIELGSKYDITDCLTPITNSSASLLTQYSGRYNIVFKNTDLTTYGTYTITLEVNYVRVPWKQYGARGGYGTVYNYLYEPE
jgi:hypothetical protein